MNRGHPRTCGHRHSIIAERGFTLTSTSASDSRRKPLDKDDLLDFMEEMVETFAIRIHMHTFMPLPATPWAERASNH
jgi:hypothetical protein